MDLGFEEQPNYDFYKQMFKNLYRKKNFHQSSGNVFETLKDERPLDWIVLK